MKKRMIIAGLLGAVGFVAENVFYYSWWRQWKDAIYLYLPPWLLFIGLAVLGLSIGLYGYRISVSSPQPFLKWLPFLFFVIILMLALTVFRDL